MKLFENKEKEKPKEQPKKRQKTSNVKTIDQFNDDSDTEDEELAESRSLIEISKYFNYKFGNENFDDLFSFWFKYSNEFPILYKVAKKVLAIPATEFESERNFSVTWRIQYVFDFVNLDFVKYSIL